MSGKRTTEDRMYSDTANDIYWDDTLYEATHHCDDEDCEDCNE